MLSDYWPGAKDSPSDHEDRGGIVVGSDVWLGTNCTVVAGVTIGHGAIVAAGAIVTKDVEPYAIVAGNPARLIRKRCSDEQIRDLLAIAWWDWPDEKIQAEVSDFNTLSVDDFIRRHGTIPRAVSRPGVLGDAISPEGKE